MQYESDPTEDDINAAVELAQKIVAFIPQETDARVAHMAIATALGHGLNCTIVDLGERQEFCVRMCNIMHETAMTAKQITVN